jgi:Chromosome segregation ATPases
MENYKEGVPEELQKQLARLNQTFTERTQEYEKQEKALEKRKIILDAASEKLSIERARLERQKAELDNREAMLQDNETLFENNQKEWKASVAEIEEKQVDSSVEYTVLVEELKTERMKLKREREEIRAEREIEENGMAECTVDLDQYILKAEVEEDYIEKKKIEQNYIEKVKYEERIKEVEAQRDKATEEKTSLLRKVLVMQQETGQSTSPMTQRNEETVEETVKTQETVNAEEVMKTKGSGKIEEPSKTEAHEDLTAEVLERYLHKNPHGFTTPQMLHSEAGEQILVKRNALTCRFVFDEPAYFDISIERENNRKLQKTLKEFNQAEQYQGVEFRYEDGRAYATGYFTTDMPSYSLVKEVERITECFNE